MAIFDTPIVDEGSREAERLRCAGKTALAEALRDARERSLALFDAYETALGPDLRVPPSHELNLPLWELGHIGWFADWWIARNPELDQRHGGRIRMRRAGRPASPAPTACTTPAPWHTPPAGRWTCPMPRPCAPNCTPASTNTLACLDQAQEDDQGLYFFRLALFHEDMHTEAATYMAQTLGLRPVQPRRVAPPRGRRHRPRPETCTSRPPTGHWAAKGRVLISTTNAASAIKPSRALQIDSQPVSWARYLPFVESGAADAREHWSEAGWAWRQAQTSATPRYLQTDGQRLAKPALRHLASTGSERTGAPPHGPRSPGLVPLGQTPTAHRSRVGSGGAHPARFSVGHGVGVDGQRFRALPRLRAPPLPGLFGPWFDGRPVLKGASPATAPRMRHARYRNFFPADRNDIVAGFRSVAGRPAD